MKKVANLNDDIYHFIKTILIVGIFFLIFFILTMLLKKYNVFDKGYTPPQLQEAKITYTNILAGMTYNRSDSEYYVIFDKFSSNDSNFYLNYILNKKTIDIPIYKVDMNLNVNKTYLNDVSNPKAKNINELSIKDVTLIKIKNGKNVLYLEDLELIKKELIK